VRVRQRHELEPVRFVAVERAFKPQVKVRATRDLSGWANRERRVKWSIGKGRVGCLDEDVAREFLAKGYVEIIEGGESIKPVSADEAAEILSTVTTIGL
jgi:hypothetical protein